MIGIFGGSFDPPHFGHIKSALALLDYFEFEQIRFVPCQQSPHKNSIYASAQDRWQMLSLICDRHDKLMLDDCELNRKPPSYTIDTLIELREKFGEQQSLVLILGVDAYLKFCQWHRYEEILFYSHILLMQRPGYSLPETICEKNYLETYMVKEIKLLENNPCGKIFLSDMKKINISSTEIRKIIADGDQPRYTMPGNIWNYIKRNKLYK